MAKLLFGTCCTLLLCLCISLNTKADIISLSDMGNTIVPIDEANISMEAETVSVIPMMGGDVAHCKFVMKSHSDSTITALVGFPINRPPWYPQFSVKVNGSDVPVMKTLTGTQDRNPMKYVLYYTSDHIGLDYPEFYTWEVEWNPHETVIIEIRYTAGSPGVIDGIVRGRKFHYIVRTGGFWRGPIGNAVITAELLWNLFSLPEYIGAENITERLSYPESGIKEFTGEKNILLSWEFNDWNPKEDISYEVFGWAGIDGLYETYLLPQEYLGAVEMYTEACINDLTEIEFEKAEIYYPERADTTDRDPYRYAIAEILRNEILARNGFTFHAYNFPEDNWARYFMKYRKMDWFNYRSTLSKSEAIERFNECEQKNYEFLGRYLKLSDSK